jgi:hypothetical protein
VGRCKESLRKEVTRAFKISVSLGLTSRTEPRPQAGAHYFSPAFGSRCQGRRKAGQSWPSVSPNRTCPGLQAAGAYSFSHERDAALATVSLPSDTPVRKVGKHMRYSACGSRKISTAPEFHPGGIHAMRVRRK